MVFKTRSGNDALNAKKQLAVLELTMVSLEIIYGKGGDFLIIKSTFEIGK
jgi:hypothetical protein